MVLQPIRSAEYHTTMRFDHRRQQQRRMDDQATVKWSTPRSNRRITNSNDDGENRQDNSSERSDRYDVDSKSSKSLASSSHSEKRDDTSSVESYFLGLLGNPYTSASFSDRSSSRKSGRKRSRPTPRSQVIEENEEDCIYDQPLMDETTIQTRDDASTIQSCEESMSREEDSYTLNSYSSEFIPRELGHMDRYDVISRQGQWGADSRSYSCSANMMPSTSVSCCVSSQNCDNLRSPSPSLHALARVENPSFHRAVVPVHPSSQTIVPYNFKQGERYTDWYDDEQGRGDCDISVSPVHDPEAATRPEDLIHGKSRNIFIGMLVEYINEATNQMQLEEASLQQLHVSCGNVQTLVQSTATALLRESLTVNVSAGGILRNKRLQRALGLRRTKSVDHELSHISTATTCSSTKYGEDIHPTESGASSIDTATSFHTMNSKLRKARLSRAMRPRRKHHDGKYRNLIEEKNRILFRAIVISWMKKLDMTCSELYLLSLVQFFFRYFSLTPHRLPHEYPSLVLYTGPTSEDYWYMCLMTIVQVICSIIEALEEIDETTSFLQSLKAVDKASQKIDASSQCCNLDNLGEKNHSSDGHEQDDSWSIHVDDSTISNENEITIDQNGDIIDDFQFFERLLLQDEKFDTPCHFTDNATTQIKETTNCRQSPASLQADEYDDNLVSDPEIKEILVKADFVTDISNFSYLNAHVQHDDDVSDDGLSLELDQSNHLRELELLALNDNDESLSKPIFKEYMWTLIVETDLSALDYVDAHYFSNIPDVKNEDDGMSEELNGLPSIESSLAKELSYIRLPHPFDYASKPIISEMAIAEDPVSSEQTTTPEARPSAPEMIKTPVVVPQDLVPDSIATQIGESLGAAATLRARLIKTRERNDRLRGSYDHKRHNPAQETSIDEKQIPENKAKDIGISYSMSVGTKIGESLGAAARLRARLLRVREQKALKGSFLDEQRSMYGVSIDNNRNDVPKTIEYESPEQEIRQHQDNSRPLIVSASDQLKIEPQAPQSVQSEDIKQSGGKVLPESANALSDEEKLKAVFETLVAISSSDKEDDDTDAEGSDFTESTGAFDVEEARKAVQAALLQFPPPTHVLGATPYQHQTPNIAGLTAFYEECEMSGTHLIEEGLENENLILSLTSQPSTSTLGFGIDSPRISDDYPSLVDTMLSSQVLSSPKARSPRENNEIVLYPQPGNMQADFEVTPDPSVAEYRANHGGLGCLACRQKTEVDLTRRPCEADKKNPDFTESTVWCNPSRGKKSTLFLKAEPVSPQGQDSIIENVEVEYNRTEKRKGVVFEASPKKDFGTQEKSVVGKSKVHISDEDSVSPPLSVLEVEQLSSMEDKEVNPSRCFFEGIECRGFLHNDESLDSLRFVYKSGADPSYTSWVSIRTRDISSKEYGTSRKGKSDQSKDSEDKKCASVELTQKDQVCVVRYDSFDDTTLRTFSMVPILESFSTASDDENADDWSLVPNITPLLEEDTGTSCCVSDLVDTLSPFPEGDLDVPNFAFQNGDTERIESSVPDYNTKLQIADMRLEEISLFCDFDKPPSLLRLSEGTPFCNENKSTKALTGAQSINSHILKERAQRQKIVSSIYKQFWLENEPVGQPVTSDPLSVSDVNATIGTLSGEPEVLSSSSESKGLFMSNPSRSMKTKSTKETKHTPAFDSERNFEEDKTVAAKKNLGFTVMNDAAGNYSPIGTLTHILNDEESINTKPEESDHFKSSSKSCIPFQTSIGGESIEMQFNDLVMGSSSTYSKRTTRYKSLECDSQEDLGESDYDEDAPIAAPKRKVPLYYFKQQPREQPDSSNENVQKKHATESVSTEIKLAVRELLGHSHHDVSYPTPKTRNTYGFDLGPPERRRALNKRSLDNSGTITTIYSTDALSEEERYAALAGKIESRRWDDMFGWLSGISESEGSTAGSYTTAGASSWTMSTLRDRDSAASAEYPSKPPTSTIDPSRRYSPVLTCQGNDQGKDRQNKDIIRTEKKSSWFGRFVERNDAFWTYACGDDKEDEILKHGIREY